jgi:hypothetical protein
VASVKRRVTRDSKATSELPFSSKVTPADVQLLLFWRLLPSQSYLVLYEFPICPAFNLQYIGSVITRSHQLRLYSTTWHSSTIRKQAFGWHPHSLCYLISKRLLHLCKEDFFCTSSTFPLQQDCTNISVGSLFYWVVGAELLPSRILWKAALLEAFKSFLTTGICGLPNWACCGNCAERIRFCEVSG